MPKFSPSANIVRDENRELDYLVTANAERAYKTIADNFHSGSGAFSLLGTYGTGKSSFLLAMERQLREGAKFFKADNLDDYTPFKFIKVIGSYDSCEKVLAKALGANGRSEEEGIVFEQLKKIPNTQCYIIVIDEFGKFLEYAGKNNPEKEMYFIQKLAEYVSDPGNNAILITTLHQSFDAYAIGLDQKQRNEWEKVKGRLTEVPFQEPVEQLLHIAAARIPKIKRQKPEKNIDDLFKIAIKNGFISFSLKQDQILPRKLFPLDILSASVLAKGLQKYGQNERSLFTFLEADALGGLKAFQKSQKKGPTEFFDLAQVYDYLIFNHYSTLTSYHNPDFFKWRIINDSIDRIDTQFQEEYQDTAKKVVKAIGLLNIFSSKGAKINASFLRVYGKQILDIPKIDNVISLLEGSKIIRFQKFRQNYVLYEGSDFDLEQALQEASPKVELPTDLVPRLLKYFQLSYLPAKSYFYETGTPRYFKFVLSEEPIEEIKKEDAHIDGYINLIFASKIKKASLTHPQILYGQYKETESLRQLIREIDITDFVDKQIIDDKIAKRELGLRKSDLLQQLNATLMEPVVCRPQDVSFIYQGAKISKLKNPTDLNKYLSEVCKTAFPDVPNYRNELVNKTRFSSAISTARKRLIEAIVENWRKKDLGFPVDKFPPEKTIYLSLLASNLHVDLGNEEFGFINKPLQKSFIPLWNSGEEFLSSAKDSGRKLSELVTLWRGRPFGIKQGFIDVWLPIYLFIKRNEFTLYDSDQRLIPYLTHDTLDLILRKPQNYYVKSLELDGKRLNIFNKYRELTQLDAQEKISKEGFLDTFMPFISFYRQLPEFAKHTKNLSSTTLAFRNALIYAKDPEKIFFEEFPSALGFTLNDLSKDEKKLTLFATSIQDSIRELREALPNLIKRVEAELLTRRGIDTTLLYDAYKATLLAQFKDVKVHLLRPAQKTFYQRLRAPMEESGLWISALCQTVLRKKIDTLTDEEEDVLSEKLADALRELDNVREFKDFESIGEGEEIIKLELTSLKRGLDQKTYRSTAKVYSKEVEKTKNILQKKLVKDKDINIAALTEILKELLENHE